MKQSISTTYQQSASVWCTFQYLYNLSTKSTSTCWVKTKTTIHMKQWMVWQVILTTEDISLVGHVTEIEDKHSKTNNKKTTKKKKARGKGSLNICHSQHQASHWWPVLTTHFIPQPLHTQINTWRQGQSSSQSHKVLLHLQPSIKHTHTMVHTQRPLRV